MRYILGHVCRYVLRWIFRHFQKQSNVLRYTPGLVLRSILRYSHEHCTSFLSDWLWPYAKGSPDNVWGAEGPRVLATDLRLLTSWFSKLTLTGVLVYSAFFAKCQATIDDQLAQHIRKGLFSRFGPFTNNVSLSRLYFFHQMSDEQWIKLVLPLPPRGGGAKYAKKSQIKKNIPLYSNTFRGKISAWLKRQWSPVT